MASPSLQNKVYNFRFIIFCIVCAGTWWSTNQLLYQKLAEPNDTQPLKPPVIIMPPAPIAPTTPQIVEPPPVVQPPPITPHLIPPNPQKPQDDLTPRDLEEKKEVEVIEDTLSCQMPTFDYFNYDSRYIRQSRLQPCVTNRSARFTSNGDLEVVCPAETKEIKVSESDGRGGKWSEWKSYPIVDKELPFTIKIQGNAASVKCDNSDADFLVHAKKKSLDKTRDQQSSFEGYNVAVIGIDSLSRAQFNRKLKETAQLFRKYAAPNVSAQEISEKFVSFDYEYYNVMGDGTLKAVVPILIGYDAGDRGHVVSGWKQSGNSLDSWPWIWYDAKKAGYVTLFSEDFCPGIFNLNLGGFKEFPADYGLNGFFCGRTPASKRASKSHTTCIGSRYAHEHHLEFVNSMHESYPNLGKISYNHFLAGHEQSLGEVEIIDKSLAKFLENFLISAEKQNTIVIVIGDHGPRYGAYRQTLNGKLEERLPALNMIFPAKFLKENPEFYQNLKINQKRLVTAFDVHNTVLQVVKMSAAPTISAEIPNKENTGFSLFGPVPTTRTCDEAGIEPHWCACLGWNLLNQSHPWLQMLVDTVEKEIQHRGGDGLGECALTNVAEITSIEVQDLGEKMRKYDISAKTQEKRWAATTALSAVNYRIQVKMSPGDGVFESIVAATPFHYVSEPSKDEQEKMRAELDKVSILYLSRISRYSHQQTCDSAPHKPQFCVCKNWLQGEKKV